MKISITVHTAQANSAVSWALEIPEYLLAGLDQEERDEAIKEFALDSLNTSPLWDWSYRKVKS